MASETMIERGGMTFDLPDGLPEGFEVTERDLLVMFIGADGQPKPTVWIGYHVPSRGHLIEGARMDGTETLYEVTAVVWRCSNLAIVGIRDAKG